MATKTWSAALMGALAIASLAATASAQTPRANGETLNIQNYAGTTGNMHAVIAQKKGFCEKYNFKCEVRTLNSGTLGLQALVGKTIDIAQTGTELTAATGESGLVLVGLSLPAVVLSVSVRADVPLPNRAKGYPEMMKDFKGLKIGTTARGSGGEVIFNAMLRDAGMPSSDVTYVAVGGPATAYTTMVVGKQVDAAVLFQPLTQLCAFNKTCATVIDMTVGEGPKSVKDMTGASVVFVARREMADSNPNLMAAFYAAFRDAAAWFNDPANFEELVKIYTPLISFGDLPGADQLRRDWIKSVITAYSTDLKIDRAAVKSILDFYAENKMFDKPVDPAKLVWDKAP
jgi:NitT/TauT family transport system substrate-binding protein